jgi:hypothetical protein
MKHSILLFLSFLLLSCQISMEARVQMENMEQMERAAALDYEPSIENPYGLPNPDAPPELAQFAFLIGQNDCTEERLNNSTGEWVPGTRTWDANYFMNGHAIQDGGSSGATTNGNIRIYDAAAEQWQVTFFSMPVYSSGSWSGGMEESELVLRQAQKTPGTEFDGHSTLTFFNISESSFDWSGAWVSIDGSVTFPFWRVSCNKA